MKEETNKSMPQPNEKGLWEKEFDKKFNWKDCGNENFQDDIIRECYQCGFRTKYCVNCHRDHHIDDKNYCIKQFIYNLLSHQRESIREEMKKIIMDMRNGMYATEMEVKDEKIMRKVLDDLLEKSLLNKGQKENNK